MSEELYQELILDHFKNPRCKGCLDCPHRESCLLNPLCGDKIKLSLKLEDGKVSEIGFEGEGCAISQASCSILCDLCKGRGVQEVAELRSKFLKVLNNESIEPLGPELGDACVLEGVKRFPARIRCAALAWEALGKCLANNSN